MALAAVGLAALAVWYVAVSVPTVEDRIAAVAAPGQTGAAPLGEEVGRENENQGRDLLATLYASPLLLTRLAQFVKALALAGAVVLVLVCWNDMPEALAVEYHGCLLLF